MLKDNKIDYVDTNLVFANEDGDHIDVAVRIKQRNYTILHKINARIYDMGIAETMTEVCKSSKDIEMFWKLLKATDTNNSFRDISEIAKKNDIVPRSLRRMVKRMKDVGFVHPIQRGVYQVNPFQYIGKAVRSTKDMTNLQLEWKDRIDEEY